MSDKTETQAEDRMWLLNERQKLAYHLRKEGLKYKEIGKRMGVSKRRAEQFHSKAMNVLSREPHWTDGLNSRAKNVLSYFNLNSREEAMKLCQSRQMRCVRNCGPKTHRHLMEWLGISQERHWTDGLDTRIVSVLYNCNIKSREELVEASQSGRLLGMPYCGPVTLKKIAEWLAGNGRR